jgi:hypothetical protein
MSGFTTTSSSPKLPSGRACSEVPALSQLESTEDQKRDRKHDHDEGHQEHDKGDGHTRECSCRLNKVPVESDIQKREADNPKRGDSCQRLLEEIHEKCLQRVNRLGASHEKCCTSLSRTKACPGTRHEHRPVLYVDASLFAFLRIRSCLGLLEVQDIDHPCGVHVAEK